MQRGKGGSENEEVRCNAPRLFRPPPRGPRNIHLGVVAGFAFTPEASAAEPARLREPPAGRKLGVAGLHNQLIAELSRFLWLRQRMGHPAVLPGVPFICFGSKAADVISKGSVSSWWYCRRQVPCLLQARFVLQKPFIALHRSAEYCKSRSSHSWRGAWTGHF